MKFCAGERKPNEKKEFNAPNEFVNRRQCFDVCCAVFRLSAYIVSGSFHLIRNSNTDSLNIVNNNARCHRMAATTTTTATAAAGTATSVATLIIHLRLIFILRKYLYLAYFFLYLLVCRFVSFSEWPCSKESTCTKRSLCAT